MKKNFLIGLWLVSCFYLAIWLFWAFSFFLYIGAPEGSGTAGDFLPWWWGVHFGNNPVVACILIAVSFIAATIIPKWEESLKKFL